MSSHRSVAFFLLLAGLGFAAALLSRSAETGFLNRTVTVGRTTYRYQVYVPAGWSQEQKWPVILFLHGAGERGEDGLLQTEVGIGTAIRRHSERFPCLVVFPQCRNNAWWAEPEMEAQALTALEQTLQEFNGDPARIYLTGLSMGGYGTWSLAARHPGKFAALAPICGGIRPPPGLASTQASPTESSDDPYMAVARKIGKTPVWVFHGSADAVVPVSESRQMVEALRSIGGNVHYTEYEGVGHNAWDRAYDEPDFLPWLFAQRADRAKPSAR